MKSTNQGRSESDFSKRNYFGTYACVMALAALISLPVFAQRGEGNREKRQEGSRGQSQVRSGQQDKRGNAAQFDNAPRSNAPQTRDANRENVRRNDARPSGNDRVSAPRSNSPQYRDNRPYEPRYDRYYGKWPARGATVRFVPQGGFWRVHNGVRYMYHNGFYYRPYGSSYIVVAPPVGFHIASLPVGFVAFTLANMAYYYYAGTYYQRYNNEYVVVQPPLGALVQTIPEGGQQVVIDGTTYFIVDGVQYQAVLFRGSIWYKVIKIENRVDDYNGENPY